MELTMQKKVVLGIQHTVAMFGATVLVPLVANLTLPMDTEDVEVAMPSESKASEKKS